MSDLASLNSLGASLAGTVPQTTSVVPPTAPGAMTMSAPAAPAAPSGRALLPTIAHSVEMEESGGKQDRVSKAGAIGVMQLMPETAAGLGVDPRDEGQNREGGTRLLGQLFDKYGNWKDALAAYNWGPGNFDKWVSSGRDESKLPDETSKYVPQVLARAGIEGTPAGDLLSSKRAGDQADLEQLGKSLAPAQGAFPQASAPATAAPTFDEALGTALSQGIDPGGFYTPAFGEQSAALVSGVRKGVTDLATGPVQFILEQTSPQTAAAFTQKVNELEERFGGAGMMEKHPAMATAGQALGIGLSLLGAGAGAAPLTARLGASIPKLARALIPAGTGAALGATSYNADPEHTSRAVEAVLGGVAGELGRQVGNAASWAARKIADRSTFNSFLALMKDSVGSLNRNTAQPLANIIEHAKAVMAQANRLYGSRNVAGRGFEGFEEQPLRDVVEGYANESRVNGVAVAPATRAWANRVYEELGLKDADAREIAAATQEKQHAREMAEWEKSYGTGIPENYREAIVKRDVNAGRIPPPPTPPVPHAPEPVSAAQFSAALTAVNRGLRSVSKKDGAAIKQLTQIKAGLEKAAAEEAAAQGVSTAAFLRRAKQANDFYASNVAPLRDIFGTANPAELARSITPAMFFDRVVHTIEGGDTTKLQALMKAVGPRAAEDMKRVALWQALNKGQPREEKFDGRKMADWISSNRESLQTLFGRDGAAELSGWQRIADRVNANPLKHRDWLAGTRSILPFVGAEEMIRGEFFRGATLIAAPYAVHALFSLFSRMDRVPAIAPLVRRAAALRPESPELEALMKVIQRRYQTAGLIAGRTATAPEGVPAGGMSFAPVPVQP